MKYVLILVLFVVAVLLQAFSPAWRRKMITIRLSDDELLALFAPVAKYSPLGYQKELKQKTGIDHPLSEVAECLEKLVSKGKIKREQVPIDFVISSFQQADDYIPTQTVYFL